MIEYCQSGNGFDVGLPGNFIAGTTTRTGLKIRAELDANVYPKGIQVTDKKLEKVQIQKAYFHGEWNYIILPPDIKLYRLFLDSD